MSVEMKLGRWEDEQGGAWLIVRHDEANHTWHADGGEFWFTGGSFYDDGSNSELDLIRYLGPLELSPTPARAEAGPAGDPQTVSTEDPQESLRRMRAQWNALCREEAAYGEALLGVQKAKGDLEEAIKVMEKEVEG